jgi:hypothetical protein
VSDWGNKKLSNTGRTGPARGARGPRNGRAGRSGHFAVAKSSSASRQPSAAIGMLEWFRPGEHDRVDSVLDDLQALGVTELRTGVS